MAKGLTPLLLALLACQASLLLADIPQEVEPSYRLPGEAVPTLYELTLEPDLDKFTFKGTAKITIEAKTTKNTITLNAKDLKISSIDLLGSDNKAIKVDGVLVPKQELLVVKLSQDLVVNNTYVLTVQYSAALNDLKRGFYRSRYFDKDNKVKYVAATHFEPTGARLAFPCWDEPAYKAEFKVSIVHSEKHVAISNMPEESSTGSGNGKLTTFKKSPKMSSYLVAFVVSDYGNSNNTDSTFRVWTKPQAVNQTQYALEKGEQILNELDKYTNIKMNQYVPQMDQVSLKDFAPSAMENWGLVTYRETSLLYQDGVTTTRTKQSITTVIAHEFAHQWFGDLVSPKWWTYIWLNEGFANYFQYHIFESLLPEWRLNEVFAVDVVQGSAFVADADENVRPMNKEVTTPQEISALFDSIAYQKAGSVIRMMSHILSEETFRKGLQTYLGTMKLGNADSNDLLGFLGANAVVTWGDDKVSFTNIMDEWVNKPGYPLVTVKKDKDGKCVITQERFLLNNKANKDNTKWWVPLTYFTQSNINKNTTVVSWLKPTENQTTVTVNKDGWVLFNTLQTGYYRVNYDEENWNLLSKFLNSANYSKIFPVNRAQLIDDALNMARTNRLNYDVALSLTFYLHQEVDYIPWQTTFRNLNLLQNLMRTSEHYHIFKNYISYIMTGLTKEVKYLPQSNDTDVTRLLRVNAFRWACRAGVQDCVKAANDEFRNWRTKNSYELDVNLKNNILCAALRSTNETAWNETLKVLSSTEDEDTRKSLFSVLACSESVDILLRYLRLSLGENPVLPFHTAVQNVVSEHPNGVDVAMKLFIDEYERIKTLNDSNTVIKSTVDSISAGITNSTQYLQLSMFMANKGLEAEVLQSGLQKATKNIDWLNSNKEIVDKWLVSHRSQFSSASIAVTSFFLVLFSIFITRLY